MYANKLNFAPRVGIAQHVPGLGLVIHTAYGIFYTPVDMNTWCNQRHNVPYVFPETQQADNFTPSPALFASQLNFAQATLGQTTVSFTGLDPKAPSQYIEQWSGSLEKSLGGHASIEIGYLGAHGVQRASGSGTDWTAAAVSLYRFRFRINPSLKRNLRSTGGRLSEWRRALHADQHHQSARRHSSELVRRRLRERAPPLRARSDFPCKLHLVKEPERCSRFPLAHVRVFHSAKQQRPGS
jgi:hypothetical protein